MTDLNCLLAWRSVRESVTCTVDNASLKKVNFGPNFFLCKRSRYSDWATRLDYPRFKSGQGQEIFIYFKTSRTSVGPTQPPVQWVMEALPQVLNRPECNADHLPRSSAEIKNEWNCTSIFLVYHHYLHRDNTVFLAHRRQSLFD